MLAVELLGLARATWRPDLREDFAIIRRYLHGQNTALAAAHHIESDAHASCERFGVMAGSLLGHDAGCRVGRLL